MTLADDRTSSKRSSWGLSAREGGRDWVIRAACRGHDPEIWYPTLTGPNNAREAQRICSECPVRVECKMDADERGEPFGIWGGEARKGSEHAMTRVNRPQFYEPAPEDEAPGVFTASQCVRCGNFWAHNAGPRDDFSTVTKFCPDCVALMPTKGWGLKR